MTDQLGYLRDYGVSEGFGSLHPMGNPIIHSTNAGVGRIPSAGRPPSRCVVRQSLRVFPKVGLVKPRLLRGVGNNPETISLVGRANVSSGYAVPFRIEPERGQVAENASKPSIKQCCDVLHDDEAGSKLASEPCNFSPKARAFSRQPRSEALIADILAWEASADNVDGGDFLASQFADISVAGDTGPVLGEDAAGELFDFTECDGLETACSFEAKAKSSNAGKEIENAQLVHAAALLAGPARRSFSRWLNASQSPASRTSLASWKS